MKRWLDDRIRKEAAEVRRRASVIMLRQPQVMRMAASFRPPEAVLMEDPREENA